MSLKDHLDKIGLGGSVLTALCCLGFPAILSFMAAIGLGFLLKDTILILMLGLFLLVTLYGLYRGFKVDRKKVPMGLGVVSSVALVAFICLLVTREQCFYQRPLIRGHDCTNFPFFSWADDPRTPSASSRGLLVGRLGVDPGRSY
ncbi:MAG: MerC domain-containing protein [Acidobacteria bacterium]|nr:MerC domain-containing protein [Acidobacteriota bacterium]